MKNPDDSIKKIGDLVFTGCMFLGAGIGWFFGMLPIGGALGLGVGFLARAAIIYADRESEQRKALEEMRMREIESRRQRRDEDVLDLEDWEEERIKERRRDRDRE